MDRCKLCGEPDKRYRHVLSKVASSTKIAIRAALSCEVHPRVFNDGQYLEEGYTFRPCLRRGEKLHQLQDDLARIRQQFREAVSSGHLMDANAPASVIVPASNPAESILSDSCSNRIPNPKRLRLESVNVDATPVKVQFEVM